MKRIFEINSNELLKEYMIVCSYSCIARRTKGKIRKLGVFNLKECRNKEEEEIKKKGKQARAMRLLYCVIRAR